jgi:hypothetical protein
VPRGRRPLWSPPWVLVFLLFIFTALDALPCLALFRIYLLLPGTRGWSYTGNEQCFFFLLLPGTGTGGGSYTGNSSSSSLVGGSAPLDSVTVGSGVRFDGSLVAGMDETSVRLDGWRFERADSGVASPKAFIYRWQGRSSMGALCTGYPLVWYETTRVMIIFNMLFIPNVLQKPNLNVIIFFILCPNGTIKISL